VASGRLTTIDTNGKINFTNRVYFDVVNKRPTLSKGHIFMGDDAVQRFPEDDLKDFIDFCREECGNVYTVESERGVFTAQNYCSFELFQLPNGQYGAMPVNLQKHLFRLRNPLSKDEAITKQTLLSYCVEYVHSDEWFHKFAMCLNILDQRDSTSVGRSREWCYAVAMGWEAAERPYVPAPTASAVVVEAPPPPNPAAKVPLGTEKVKAKRQRKRKAKVSQLDSAVSEERSPTLKPPMVKQRTFAEVAATPPASRLVGIEPNPGPARERAAKARVLRAHDAFVKAYIANMARARKALVTGIPVELTTDVPDARERLKRALQVSPFHNGCAASALKSIAPAASALVVPPAPRLVGVETNPGPTHKKGKAPNSRRVQHAKARNPTPRKAKRQRAKKERKANKPALTQYTNTLRDPWYGPPIRLGWGCFVPTSLRTAFFRTVAVIDAIRPVDTYIMNPEFWVAPFARTNNGFLHKYQTVNGAGLYSSGDWFPYGSTNNAYLSSTVQSSRVVSSALRVTVHYGAMNVPGNLFGLYLPEEQAAVVNTQNADSLIGNFAARRAINTTAGEVIIEVQYRPFDTVNFDFFNGGGSGISTPHTSQMIVIASGFPAGSTVTVEAIVHYESNGGLDASSDDTVDSAMTLSASGVTMDEAGAMAARSPPVATSGWAMETLDRALSNFAAKTPGSRHWFVGAGGASTSRNNFITPNASDPAVLDGGGARANAAPRRSRSMLSSYVLSQEPSFSSGPPRLATTSPEYEEVEPEQPIRVLAKRASL